MQVYGKRHLLRGLVYLLILTFFISPENVYGETNDKLKSYLLPPLTLDILSTTAIHQKLFIILDSEKETEKLWNGREVFGMGLVSLKAGDLSSAEEFFLRALREYGMLKDYTVFYLSRVLAEQGKFKESVIALKDLIKNYPNSSLIYRAYKHLANIYFVLNDYEAAIDTYFVCLQYSSEDEVLIKYQIGVARMQLHEWSAARDIFCEVLIKGPQTPYFRAVLDYLDILENEHNMLAPSLSYDELTEKACVEMKKKLYVEAAETYETILSRFPEHEGIDSIQYKYAVCLLRLNKKEKALKILESLDTPEALLLLGRTCWNNHESTKAETLFNKLLERFKNWPDNDKVIYYLGRIAEERKEYESARKIYMKIIDKVPDGEFEKNALWRIGWGYYSAGEYKEAADFFSQWAERFSSYDMVDKHKFYYWQATALEKMQKHESARTIYKKIFDDSYWSYYSGCASMKVKDIQDPFTQKRISFKCFEKINRNEQRILNEIKELTLFELEEEVRDKIEYYLNRNGYSIGFYYQLAILAYMNMHYDVSIDCASQFYYKVKPDELTAEDEAMLFPLAYKDKIGILSHRYKINPWIIISLIRQESFFDPQCLSIAQAYGLMQIIPPLGYKLANKLRPSTYFAPESMYDPNINLEFGFHHFQELLGKFDQNIIHAIAAYNAGSGAVSSWEKRFPGCTIEEFIENIPFGETRKYVKRILRNCWMYYRIYSQNITLTRRRRTNLHSDTGDP
ncbi:MAG: tetratricopeptide repeat protein [bacterium]